MVGVLVVVCRRVEVCVCVGSTLHKRTWEAEHGGGESST